MNSNFDFDSKKYLLLLVVICCLFCIFIIKAFDYLPVKENAAQDSYVGINNINSPASNTTIINNNSQEEKGDVDSQADENSSKIEHKSGVLYKSKDPELNSITIDEIKAPKEFVEGEFVEFNQPDKSSDNLSLDEEILRTILRAKKNASNADLSAALRDYKKVIEITKNNDILAECYEGISILYAKNKNYDTALSFAQKANELSPSVIRELLIAKLYYNLGSIDTAITRINSILKRSF